MSETVNGGGTAHLYEGQQCKDCGWPIVFACCNGEFENFKDAGEWDWWVYCSNKGCQHHEGEGIFQHPPDWMEDDPEYIHVDTSRSAEEWVDRLVQRLTTYVGQDACSEGIMITRVPVFDLESAIMILNHQTKALLQVMQRHGDTPAGALAQVSLDYSRAYLQRPSNA